VAGFPAFSVGDPGDGGRIQENPSQAIAIAWLFFCF